MGHMGCIGIVRNYMRAEAPTWQLPCCNRLGFCAAHQTKVECRSARTLGRGSLTKEAPDSL